MPRRQFCKQVCKLICKFLPVPGGDSESLLPPFPDFPNKINAVSRVAPPAACSIQRRRARVDIAAFPPRTRMNRAFPRFKGRILHFGGNVIRLQVCLNRSIIARIHRIDWRDHLSGFAPIGPLLIGKFHGFHARCGTRAVLWDYRFTRIAYA